MAEPVEQQEPVGVEDPNAMGKRMQFEAPLPGEGLLGDPDNPLPFERPPEFTNYDQAKDHIFESLMDVNEQIIDMLEAGLDVETVTEQVLTMGYNKGKWTVDLMLLLIEPTMYTILFICEMAGVDYIIAAGEEDEFTDSETQFKAEGHISKYITQVSDDVEASVAKEGAEESIAAVLPPSLLQRAEKQGV